MNNYENKYNTDYVLFTSLNLLIMIFTLVKDFSSFLLKGTYILVVF